MATPQPKGRAGQHARAAASEEVALPPRRPTPEPVPRRRADQSSVSRTAARKTTARKPTEPAPRQLAPGAVAARAAEQLLELTGREGEGVTGLARTQEGWTVQVEVLEARRIPDTTDVLALYEVDVDDAAELVGYRRVRRYVRGKPNEG